MTAAEKSTTGTLYGIGVGPGSPDLITLRAVSVLNKVSVVLAASSTKNEYSTALSIAKPHLAEHARIVHIAFPMTLDEENLLKAWEENAHVVAKVLEQGQDAAFLTLGDPLIYSTFGYIMRTMANLYPHIPVNVVPGITSFQAAAAETKTVICERYENFLLLPGVMNAEKLRSDLTVADNAVILKAYKTLPDIKDALKNEEDRKDALFISRLGLDDQVITPLENAPESPNYLSLVLATRKNRV